MLSIIIVNWNTRDVLCQCLASLYQHPFGGEFEVIVVDNASKDGSADAVRSQFPAARLIASTVNSGYAAGNNMGFAVAKGDYLLTLNPDTEVYEDTLDRAVAKLAGMPDYGALGAKQIYVDGTTQASVRGFPSVRGILGDLLKFGKRKPGSVWDSYRLTGFDYHKEQDAPQPMGTFLLFKRQALQALQTGPTKPFDERFPIFFNEVDLLYRLNQAGWKCEYSPEVRILHHGGEGTKQVRKNMIWESHKSLLRFMRLHYQTAWNTPGFWVLAVILYGAAFIRARGYHAGFRP